MKPTLLLLILAACDHPDTFADGGAGDDVVDVQVVRRPGETMPGAPDEGVVVLFHDADGVMVARALTDADGRASAAVPAGGSVTIWDADNPTPRLATVFAVEPGDELQFATGHWGRVQAGSVGYEVPAYPGAIAYGVHGVCVSGGGEASSGTAYVLADCGAPAPTLAFASTTAGVQGYLYDPAVTAVVAEVLTMTGTWEPPGSVDVDVAGAAGLRLLEPQVSLFVDGALLYADVGPALALDGSGHAAASWAFPISGGDQTVAQVRIDDATGLRTSMAYVTDGTRQTSFAVDAGELLAFAPDLTATATGATWAPVEGEADGLSVWLSAGAAIWTTSLPPTATSLTLPSLPDDLAALGSGAVVPYGAYVLDSSALDGYADFRAIADLEADTSRFSAALPRDGAERLRIAYTSVPPP